MLYLIPTYIIIMVIYSITNISDITWGNRPDKADITHLTSAQRRTDEIYKAFRTKVLISWMLLNLIMARIIIGFTQA